jgi:acyl-CoA thioester hydrolase
MAFLKKLYGRYEVHDIDFVLAGLKINYHSRAGFREKLTVEMRVTRVGNTSWTFTYRIAEKKSQRLIAEGESTQVLFDYSKGVKRAIPEWLGKKLGNWI